MNNQEHGYFNKLNYTLANEDTRVEYELLPEGATSVFAVSGSGARVLPLLARNPQELDVIDLSQEQLYLCELRIEAARTLSYDEFLFFMGYRGGLPTGGDVPHGDSRIELFKRLSLSPECAQFWLENTDHWTPYGIILLGRWERHFQKLGRLFRNFLRIRIDPVFEAQSLDEQRTLYRKHFKPLLFSAFLRVVASEYVFNRFLYKGHFSGAAGRSTEARPPWKFIQEEFHRIFHESLVRKNYFMQILFLGQIRHEEGLPLEAQAHIIDGIKKAKTKVRYFSGDLLTYSKKRPYDFFSFSDTISYLPEDSARTLLTSLHPEIPSGARAVIRSFMRAPGIEPPQSWTREPSNEALARSMDGTAVYEFHIFRKH